MSEILHRRKIQYALSIAIIILTSMISAINYKVFVFPNSFAPSGVDGICTMIMYITKTNMGYLSLLFNIPLLIYGFFTVKRDFLVKTTVYILSFSSSMIMLDYIDISKFFYYTETGTSIVLAPIAAGVIRGLLYPITLKAGGSSGGVDLVAAITRYYKPHLNFMNIVFAFNTGVALLSYFVYGFKIEPVICSIIYAFVTSTVSKSIQSMGKEQIRFEIITSDAIRLCEMIKTKLGLTSTVIDAKGAFSGADKKMVICVSNKENGARLEKFLSDYPDSVVFESLITTSMNMHKI